MNEDASMFRSQCYEIDYLCERCAHMYTHSHFLWINEWMKLKNVNEKGCFGVNTHCEFKWSVLKQPHYLQRTFKCRLEDGYTVRVYMGISKFIVDL